MDSFIQSINVHNCAVKPIIKQSTLAVTDQISVSDYLSNIFFTFVFTILLSSTSTSGTQNSSQLTALLPLSILVSTRKTHSRILQHPRFYTIFLLLSPSHFCHNLIYMMVSACKTSVVKTKRHLELKLIHSFHRIHPSDLGFRMPSSWTNLLSLHHSNQRLIL